MSGTTLIFIALIVWMAWMHMRPGGHGGCASHGSRASSSHTGERDGH
jgi:hypothetical protein